MLIYWTQNFPSSGADLATSLSHFSSYEVVFPSPLHIRESLSLTLTNERQLDYTDLSWVDSPKLLQANSVDFIATVHTAECDREKTKTKRQPDLCSFGNCVLFLCA